MKVSGTKKNARGGVGLASRSQDGRHVEKADPTTRNRPRKDAQEGGVSLKGRSLSSWTPARIGLLSRESKRGPNRAVRTGFLTSRPRSWRSISSTRPGTKQQQAGTSLSPAARPARPVRTVASHRRARTRATGAPASGRERGPVQGGRHLRGTWTHRPELRNAWLVAGTLPCIRWPSHSGPITGAGGPPCVDPRRSRGT